MSASDILSNVIKVAVRSLAETSSSDDGIFMHMHCKNSFHIFQINNFVLSTLDNFLGLSLISMQEILYYVRGPGFWT